MSQREFLTLCSTVWPSDPTHVSTDLTEESLSRMKTVLDLFHQWGVVFVLPTQLDSRGGVEDSGDIILDPQQLTNVFKCVITCNSETTSSINNRQLFEDGILVHTRVGFVWPDYEARFHHEFLCLLHQCDLAYEMFDFKGDPTGRSLVPSLLPYPALDLMDEAEVRQQLMSVWETASALDRMKIGMISRGVVKIMFESLLSNFFPKLLVRLRVLTSVVDCSRHHCVVHVAQRGVGGALVGWSLACVVQDRASDALLVYPGGCSFDATAIVHHAIRGLMKELFSGMSLKDVTLSAEEEVFSRWQIVNYLKTNVEASARVSSNLLISLSFMSCLLPELDQTQGLPPISSLSSLLFSNSHLQTLLSLQSRLAQYESSNHVGDKWLLAHFLIESMPALRECGLGLSSKPAILWLIGATNSTVHGFGVSPSMNPSSPWEVVWDCEVSYPSLLAMESEMGSPLHELAPLNELLLRCLRLLLPDQRLPDRGGGVDGRESVEWIGVSDCFSEEGKREMAFQETAHFVMSHSVFGGEMVYYSKEVLRQRGQVCAEDLKSIVKGGMEEVMRDTAMLG
jgi:hypothetical protein